jgi:DNA-binding MarR family transcriptional regulator
MGVEMATKNTTAAAANRNGADGAHGAGDGAAGMPGGVRPAGAAGAVWDALRGNPGGTVAGLAAAAGVSRATVGRVLTTLEADGCAVPTRGSRDGGKSQPDTWHTADTTTGGTADTTTGGTADTGTTTGTTSGAVAADTGAGVTATAPTGSVPDAGTDAGGDAVSGPAAPTGAGTGDTGAQVDGDGETGLDPAAVAEARDALTALREGITAALEAGDGEAAVLAAEGAYSGSGLVRRLVRAAAWGPVRTVSGRVRSQPGAMRAKVAAHLTAHPGAAFTPHEVAKVIGHSAGAVSNALDRLVEDGDAELVCERPRRFTTTHRTTGATEATALAAR